MNRPFERQVDSTPTLRHQRLQWRTRRDAALGQWPARHLVRLLRLQETKRSRAERAENMQVLDLLAEDSRLNVYAGNLEVRPPLSQDQGGLDATQTRHGTLTTFRKSR